MCSLSPFMSTVSVLANSITLVAIAVDRYLSVIKLMRNVWETRGIYCLFFAIIIWGLSIGIAVPTLNAFKYMTVYAVQLDPHNSSVIISAAKIDLCAAGKVSILHAHTRVKIDFSGSFAITYNEFLLPLCMICLSMILYR